MTALLIKKNEPLIISCRPSNSKFAFAKQPNQNKNRSKKNFLSMVAVCVT